MTVEDSVCFAHSGPSHNLLRPATAELVSCGPLPLPESGGGHASTITAILPPAGTKRCLSVPTWEQAGAILSEKASLFKFLQTLSTVTPLPECSERGRCAQFNNFVELSTVAKCRGGWKGGRCAQ